MRGLRLGLSGRLARLALRPVPARLRLARQLSLQPAYLGLGNADHTPDGPVTDLTGLNAQAKPLLRAADLSGGVSKRDQLVLSHGGRFYAPFQKSSTDWLVDPPSIDVYNWIAEQQANMGVGHG